jgi:hypothetical protein
LLRPLPAPACMSNSWTSARFAEGRLPEPSMARADTDGRALSRRADRRDPRDRRWSTTTQPPTSPARSWSRPPSFVGSTSQSSPEPGGRPVPCEDHRVRPRPMVDKTVTGEPG